MSSSITPEQALAVLREAELLCTPEQIQAAFDRLAVAVTARLEHCNPLVLMVMNGAFIPCAQLLLRLPFPLQVGYLHATRYRSEHPGRRHRLDRAAAPGGRWTHRVGGR